MERVRASSGPWQLPGLDPPRIQDMDRGQGLVPRCRPPGPAPRRTFTGNLLSKSMSEQTGQSRFKLCSLHLCLLNSSRLMQALQDMQWNESMPGPLPCGEQGSSVRLDGLRACVRVWRGGGGRAAGRPWSIRAAAPLAAHPRDRRLAFPLRHSIPPSPNHAPGGKSCKTGSGRCACPGRRQTGGTPCSSTVPARSRSPSTILWQERGKEGGSRPGVGACFKERRRASRVGPPCGPLPSWLFPLLPSPFPRPMQAGTCGGRQRSMPTARS